jgi:hypothetical protein
MKLTTSYKRVPDGIDATIYRGAVPVIEGLFHSKAAAVDWVNTVIGLIQPVMNRKEVDNLSASQLVLLARVYYKGVAFINEAHPDSITLVNSWLCERVTRHLLTWATQNVLMPIE